MNILKFFVIFAIFSQLLDAMNPKAAEIYEQQLEKTLSNPSSENILKLENDMAGIVRYLDKGNKEDVALYSKIQGGLISIPGHSRFFVDDLEKERSAIDSVSTKNRYDTKRRMYLTQVLPHLPSPETIDVLGQYLRDHRDDPPPIDPNRPFDSSPVPSSARLASEAIMYIGLRNPPVTEATYWSLKTDQTEYALPKTIQWYDEVKSGKRSFSFIGKTVEYRFRPDGTVESKQLPMSILKNDPKPYRHPQEIQFISRITPEKSIPYWISGGIALIGGGVFWLFKKLRGRFSRSKVAQ